MPTVQEQWIDPLPPLRLVKAREQWQHGRRSVLLSCMHIVEECVSKREPKRKRCVECQRERGKA